MVRALVSASAVADVVRAHADRANDAARRLGCTPTQSAEVTRLAAEQLIDDLDRQPETVRDLVGGFLARIRIHAVALRQTRVAGATDRTPLPGAPAAVLQSAAQRAAVERALDTLGDEDRLAVLARDSYDLTVHQAAVALALDAPESARTVALARLLLIAAVEGTPPISLAGHDIAVGDLGQLADGSAPPGGRFATLRRHVAGCAQCASVLDAQTRAGAMLSALPVLALDDIQRDAILDGAAHYAATVLPADDEVRRELTEGSSRRPIVDPLITIGALLVALVLGGGVGALLSAGSSDKPSDVVTPATSASPRPTTTSAPATASSVSPSIVSSTSIATSESPSASEPPPTSVPPVASPTPTPTLTPTPTTTPTSSPSTT